jgi:uncharacterized repeat protein (TIGR04138 family)
VQKGLDSVAEPNIHEATGARPTARATGPTMTKVPFDQSVRKVTSRDPRYAADAYAFLRDALDFTIRSIKKARAKEPGHVSGPELCHGIREYALQQFGPMVPTIFEAWGLHTTRDFGEMVFNLIETGAFSKSDADRREDFDNVFTFEEAFVRPFLPHRALKPGNSSARKKGRQ